MIFNVSNVTSLSPKTHTSSIGARSILKSSAAVTVVLMGITVNFLSICVLIKTKKVVSKNARLFLICLNISDLANCINYGILAPFTLALNLHEWPFSYELCSAHSIWTNFTLAVSYYFVVSIAIDRYIAVVYPLRYEDLFTQTRARLLVVAILLVSAGFEIGGKDYEYRAEVGTCWVALHDRTTAIVHTSIVTLVAVIPFFAVIALYVRIVTIARRHSRAIAAQESSQHQGDADNRNRPDSKAIVTFFMITGVFGLAFIPYYASLFYVIASLHWPPASWSFVLRLAGLCNTWLNALVYYFRNKWFQDELNQLLVSCCRRDV